MSESYREHDQREASTRPEPPGATLSAAREKRGIELGAAAESIGVPQNVLSALEADAWDRLDAPVYVRGYLRKYARLLGLDQDAILAAYEVNAAPHDPAIRAHVTTGLGTQRDMRWLYTVSGVIVLVVLILAGLWGWHSLRSRPSRVQVPAAAASAMMAHGSAAQTAGPVGAAASLTQTGAAPAKSAPAPAHAEAGGTGEGIHLQLQMLRPSWVEVYGPDHGRLYYNLAAAGTHLKFDRARGPVSVFLGNVSGVKVVLNGEDFRIPDSDIAGNTARFELHLKNPPAPGTSP